MKYPGQIVFAGIIGLLVFLMLNSFSAIGYGLLAFVGIRYTLAVLGRTRYWVRQKGRRRYHCPICKRMRRRQRDDWVPVCYKCEWKPGLPGIRVLTHGAHVGAMRHSITSSLVLLTVIAIVVLMVPAGGFSSQYTNDTMQSEPDVAVNESQVEQYIFELTNNKRTAENRSSIVFDPAIAKRSRGHSQYMAAHGYTRHAEPNGTPLTERYNDVCARDGENVAVVVHGQETRSWVTGELIILRTELDIAQELVAEWLKSYGHHRNMMDDRWTRVGIGVAVDDSTNRVYATQTFCGPGSV